MLSEQLLNKLLSLGIIETSFFCTRWIAIFESLLICHTLLIHTKTDLLNPWWQFFCAKLGKTYEKAPDMTENRMPRWKSEQMFRGFVNIWNYFASLGNSSVCLVDPFLEKTRITPVNGINLLDFRSSSSASAIMSKLTWHYPSNFNHLPPRGNEGRLFYVFAFIR